MIAYGKATDPYSYPKFYFDTTYFSYQETSYVDKGHTQYRYTLTVKKEFEGYFGVSGQQQWSTSAECVNVVPIATYTDQIDKVTAKVGDTFTFEPDWGGFELFLY